MPTFFHVNTLAILTRIPRTSLDMQSMRETKGAIFGLAGRDNFSHIEAR